MSKFDNVSVIKKANIYFDGKCVSHTVLFADGTRKTIGVIFPSTLTFNTVDPEVMEILAGTCNVRIDNEPARTYCAGEKFSILANTKFEIETVDMLDYVCHFG